jgi:Skp family chaperone for outer membrane proteins
MRHQTYLKHHTTLTGGISLALTLFLCAPAKSATYSGCVSVNLDRIIQTSKLVKQAQRKLVDEFAKREADLNGLKRHILEVEFSAQTAKESGAKDEEQTKLEELRKLQANWAAERSRYEAQLEQRKMIVLDGLMHQAGVAYQAIGTKQGYAKLFQEGQDEPVFKPLPGAEGYECSGKSDVTQDVLKEMDKDL